MEQKQMQPIKAGEIWRVNHCRKGDLTVRLNKDFDPDAEWIVLEIIEGIPKYVSVEANLHLYGDKPQAGGADLECRADFVTWIEEVVFDADRT